MGKASALIGIGYILGEVLSMGILFRITAGMSHYIAFSVASVVGGVFSTFFLCLVKEPDLKQKRRSEAGIESILELNNLGQGPDNN